MSEVLHETENGGQVVRRDDGSLVAIGRSVAPDGTVFRTAVTLEGPPRVLRSPQEIREHNERCDAAAVFGVMDPNKTYKIGGFVEQAPWERNQPVAVGGADQASEDLQRSKALVESLNAARFAGPPTPPPASTNASDMAVADYCKGQAARGAEEAVGHWLRSN